MRTILFIFLVIIIAFSLGIFTENKTRKDFTQNSRSIIDKLFSEIKTINLELTNNSSNELELKLLNRKKEVYSILEKFYGFDISEYEYTSII